MVKTCQLRAWATRVKHVLAHGHLQSRETSFVICLVMPCSDHESLPSWTRPLATVDRGYDQAPGCARVPGVDVEHQPGEERKCVTFKRPCA